MKGPVHPANDHNSEDESAEPPIRVRCPFCPRVFTGNRTEAEDELFKHLWKTHDDKAIEYMVQNMYIPEHIKETIFHDMGYEYVSWLVDNGEFEENG